MWLLGRSQLVSAVHQYVADGDCPIGLFVLLLLLLLSVQLSCLVVAHHSCCSSDGVQRPTPSPSSAVLTGWYGPSLKQLQQQQQRQGHRLSPPPPPPSPPPPAAARDG